MSYEQLIPQLPEEIRGARLGSCYDIYTKKVMYKKNALDINKLVAGDIVFMNGMGEYSITANYSSAKHLNEKFFGLDAKAKIKSWASLGFSMALTSSEADATTSMTCVGSYVFTGQKLYLMDLSPEEMYKRMSDDFQNAYEKVINASNETVLYEYNNFIKTFGHGCVTELELTAGSAFEIRVQNASDAKLEERKYNASAGISTPLFGASAAVSFANKESNADADAKMSCRAADIPENSPTKAWSQEYMKLFNTKAIEILTKEAASISGYVGEGPKAPDMPINTTKHEKVIPQNKMIEIDDKLQKQLMEDDGFEGTWEEYIEKQKKLYDTLSPEKVVKDPVDSSIKGLMQERYIDKEGEVSINSAWDLGGYVPCGVSYTPWNELFPALANIKIIPSFHTLYTAKTYIYYLTRLQFLGYMDIISDISNQYKNSYKVLKQCVANLENEINSTIARSERLTREKYDSIRSKFDNTLFALLKKYDESIEYHVAYMYKSFNQNYEFFSSHISGFVKVKYNVQQNSYSYLKKDGSQSIEINSQYIDIARLMEDGLRFYPLIRNTLTKAYLICYLNGEFQTKTPGYITFTGNNTAKYYDEQFEKPTDGYEIRYYAANQQFLENMSTKSVSAIPMMPPIEDTLIHSFIDYEYK